MKKTTIILLCLAAIGFSQYRNSPIAVRVGGKIGMNYGIFDFDDNNENYDGIGFHAGFGLGLDIANIAAFDITPSFRSTRYANSYDVFGTEYTAAVSFSNMYIPLTFALKPRISPGAAPYFAFGTAFNIQVDGTASLEGGGTTIKDEIDDLENDIYLIFAMGVDLKQNNLVIAPEFSFNYNTSADDEDTQNRTESNYDFHFSLGFYYTP
jgi:hypothetical protein